MPAKEEAKKEEAKEAKGVGEPVETTAGFGIGKAPKNAKPT